MPHYQDEPIVCPNCGYHAIENYCARCGQKTHLHKETFWGLLLHFFSDYFHYDSKFWKTMKTLWLKPGQLTVAYWNRERMRFIPPVSLYIFISAVFFLIAASSPNKIRGHNGLITDGTQSDEEVTKRLDSVSKARKLHPENETRSWHEYDEKRDTANFMHFLVVQGDKLDKKTNNKTGEYIVEHVYHTIPKLFFLMIPLMGLLLKGLYFNRPETYFVDHSIFSLHFHSFVFSFYILLYLPFIKYPPGITSVGFFVALCYLAASMKNAYQSHWLNAILNAVIIAIGYILFYLIVLAADILAILYFA